MCLCPLTQQFWLFPVVLLKQFLESSSIDPCLFNQENPAMDLLLK